MRLYPGIAPGSQGWSHPRTVRSRPDGGQSYANVRDPELTAYLPEPERANGTAIIMLPGGSLRTLEVGQEARDMIRLFNDAGIAVFLLTYRILQSAAAEPSSATDDASPPVPITFPKLEIRNANANPAPDNEALTNVLRLAVTDAQAALRIVRQNAAQWRIDPARVGMIGTSAGGGMAIGTVLADASGATPDFLGLVYGPALQDVVVPADAPPLFAVTECNHGPVTDGLLALFSMWKDAGKPAELHVFEVANFAMPVSMWGERFLAWMAEQGIGNAPPDSL